MLGRAATRIDLKLEDDLAEYEEFKEKVRREREQERLAQRIVAPPQANLAGSFGAHGQLGGAFNASYEQI